MVCIEVTAHDLITCAESGQGAQLVQVSVPVGRHVGAHHRRLHGSHACGYGHAFQVFALEAGKIDPSVQDESFDVNCRSRAAGGVCDVLATREQAVRLEAACCAAVGNITQQLAFVEERVRFLEAQDIVLVLFGQLVQLGVALSK